MRIRNVTDPVYAPNSMGGPQADPARAAEVHWASDGDMVRTAYALREDDDDWGQAGTLVREVLDDEARDRLAHNIDRSRVQGCQGTGALAGVRVLAQRRPRPRQGDRGGRARQSRPVAAWRVATAPCPPAVGWHDRPMGIEVIYTAESTATGGGRDGHVKSSDNRIDLDTRPPKEMGGSGEGTNPEQLFSAGYAACFLERAATGRAQREDRARRRVGHHRAGRLSARTPRRLRHQRPADRLPARAVARAWPKT